MLASENWIHTVRGSEPHTPAGRAPSHPSRRERKVSLSKQECREVANKHRAGFCEYPCHKEHSSLFESEERNGSHDPRTKMARLPI